MKRITLIVLSILLAFSAMDALTREVDAAAVSCQVSPRSVENLQELMGRQASATPVAASALIDQVRTSSLIDNQELIKQVDMFVKTLSACLQANDVPRLLALYSDEYLTRHRETVCSYLNSSARYATPSASTGPGQPVFTSFPLYQLPDGRVGVLLATAAGIPDILIVLVASNGSFQIDEMIEGVITNQDIDAIGTPGPVVSECPAATPAP